MWSLQDPVHLALCLATRSSYVCTKHWALSFLTKIALTRPNWVWCNAVTEYDGKLGRLDSVRVRTGEGWAYTYNTYEVIIYAHRLLFAGPQLGVLSGRLLHVPWGSRRHVLLKIRKAFTHLRDVTLSSQ